MIRRRDFLSAAGATGMLTMFRKPAAAEEKTDLEPVAADFDMSWIDKLTNKRKALFDSPDVAGGAGLFRANLWRTQYKQVYGVDTADLVPVLVLRHQALVLALTNEYWAEYEPGKEYKIKGEDGKPMKTNPVAPPLDPAKRSGLNIPSFITGGGIVLACNLAFGGVVMDVGKREKLKGMEARTKALTYLLPGVILQPSGVFAALRAQEAGCSYIVAS